MATYPVITDLPASLTREIGRVIVAYARLENMLDRVIFALLGIGPKEGRIALRERNSDRQLGIIKDLIALKGIKTEVDWKTLGQCLASTSRQRNDLAHGVWVRVPKSNLLLLVLTAGEWEPLPEQKVKRVVKPEGVQYGIDDCRSLIALIHGTADYVIDLLAQVEDAINGRAAAPSERLH